MKLPFFKGRQLQDEHEAPTEPLPILAESDEVTHTMPWPGPGAPPGGHVMGPWPQPVIHQGVPYPYPVFLQKASPRPSRRHLRRWLPRLVALFFRLIQLILMLYSVLLFLGIRQHALWIELIYASGTLLELPLRLFLPAGNFSLPASIDGYALLALLVYTLLAAIIVRMLRAVLA